MMDNFLKWCTPLITNGHSNVGTQVVNDLLFVGTEGRTLYALDVENGNVLKTMEFGSETTTTDGGAVVTKYESPSVGVQAGNGLLCGKISYNKLGNAGLQGICEYIMTVPQHTMSYEAKAPSPTKLSIGKRDTTTDVFATVLDIEKRFDGSEYFFGFNTGRWYYIF